MALTLSNIFSYATCWAAWPESIIYSNSGGTRLMLVLVGSSLSVTLSGSTEGETLSVAGLKAGASGLSLWAWSVM